MGDKKVTVRQLRHAGILILDNHEFLRLLDNIAFMRGDEACVENCIVTSNVEESWYIGTIDEAKEAIDHGPY